jgi:hypothetical protein
VFVDDGNANAGWRVGAKPDYRRNGSGGAIPVFVRGS